MDTSQSLIGYHVRNVDVRSLERELYQQVQEHFPEEESGWLDQIKRLVNERSKDFYWTLQQRRFVTKQLYDSVCGYDFMSELLMDPEITEIMVNGTEGVFVERYGKLEPRETVPYDEEKLFRLVQTMVAGINRRVNESEPIVDARLEHGERVNVVLPPISLVGPVITIRKFSRIPFTMEAFVRQKVLTDEAAEYLKRMVREKKNIFISGSTGTGKTTFLNVLSQEIPADQRIVTIEDSAELQFPLAKNLVRMEARGKNLEGKNAVTLRDLVKTSLRQRPDVLILGEVRGEECFDLLQVMNSGHSGLCTGHANSAVDMLSRLESMTLMAKEIPLAAIQKQIASAIHTIVHLERGEMGQRKVKEIIEVIGVKDGEYQLRWKYRDGCWIIEDQD